MLSLTVAEAVVLSGIDERWKVPYFQSVVAEALAADLMRVGFQPIADQR